MKSESEEELAEIHKEGTVTWFSLTFCIHFSPVYSLLYVISLSDLCCFLKDLIEICPDKLENYEEKLKNFFREHMHADEEISYCLEGSR
jgi:hypothetical protein